jgi:lipopolysaccharide export system protein LptC
VKSSALAFVLLAVVAHGANTALLAPAKDWSSNLFTKEGNHSMTLRGAEARFSETGAVNVVDLNLTIFAGDATNRVETILLSAAATFRPKDNTAQGEKGVRLIRDDLEATGTRWSYDHGQKRVSLHEQVRIVFNAELQGLLK